MNKALTNIVVVCWNACDYTQVAIERLVETAHKKFYLTIVNNASSDRTEAYLKKLKKPNNCVDLKVINNPENLGYGHAINQGYKVSKNLNAKYTCLCNNDIYTQDNWLMCLEDTMQVNGGIGILGTLRPSVDINHPMYCGKNTKLVVDYTPPDYTIRQELKLFFKNKCFDEGAQIIVAANGGGVKYLQSPPESVVTCCAIIRNCIIEQSIGYIADPRYTMYGSEDIDLSWMIARAGYKCAISKNVYVHHFRHKSINASGLDRAKYLKINNEIFFKKWSQEIYQYLRSIENSDISLRDIMNCENNHTYWILRRLNENIGFWDGSKIIKSKFKE